MTRVRQTVAPARVVDRFVLHGEPMSFRELCAHVLPPTSRYLVLDLDRTVHLGRNLGELLGWELGAYQTYGPDTLERLEAQRHRSRWAIDWEHPKQVATYLTTAAKRWAYPGTYYLLWGKLASNVDWLRRRAFRQFSGEPVRAAQRVPQMTLLNHLQTAPEGVLRKLAERIWKRHAPDQVIHKEDIAWVRERCPGIQVVLTSASPKAMVEYAAETLGVDHAHFSTLDHINSGESKIDKLRELSADFEDPGTEVVGMSDTGYGEDHCWAEHFTRVVDINSTAPFPAIVSAPSPLREVHSATVLTRNELRRRSSGSRHYLDPRRGSTHIHTGRELAREDLENVLGDVVRSINGIARGAESQARADIAYRIAVLTEASRARLARPQPYM